LNIKDLKQAANMSRRRILILVTVFLLFGFRLGTGELSAQVRSIEDFNKLMPEWKTLATEKKPLTVEGRYSSVMRRLLRFQNCKIAFSPETGKTFPKLNRRKKRVEVSGHLILKEKKIVFIVRTLRKLSSDFETIRLRKLAIRRENAADWYRLGNWAERRGNFYADQILLDAARDAFLKGIQVEHQKLPPRDLAGRLELAAKVKTFGLSDSLREEFVHESYRVWWDSVRSQNPQNLQNRLKKMLRDLPGCGNPLKVLQPKLKKRYEQDPLGVYRAAETETRKKLHRMLYTEVVLKKIEATANSDTSNGMKIAAEIETLLPEQQTLVEQYRERELSFRFSRIESSSRSDVLELSKLFRRRNQQKKSQQVLTKWLAAKTKEMRKEGPAGLIRIAEEYLNLMEDPKTAATLLKEAYQLSPESKEIEDRLRRMGYVLRKRAWHTAAEAAGLLQDPIDQAIREGRVVIGMTSSQVKRALGGKPTLIMRAATAGDISELWVYGRRDTTRLIIHFHRRVRRPNPEAKVIAVSQSSPRR
jgi:hypothetical protein